MQGSRAAVTYVTYEGVAKKLPGQQSFLQQ